MAAILEIRWNGKVAYQREGGPARARERSPVWVPKQVWNFEASRTTQWIHRSVLDLEDHQVSWEV